MSASTSRVILIDDSRADRKLMRRFLTQDRERHYEIFEAETGAEGLSLSRSMKPDCIVLDYQDGPTLEHMLSLSGSTYVSQPPVALNLPVVGKNRINLGLVPGNAASR